MLRQDISPKYQNSLQGEHIH